jgi:hypothetical protein
MIAIATKSLKLFLLLFSVLRNNPNNTIYMDIRLVWSILAISYANTPYKQKLASISSSVSLLVFKKYVLSMMRPALAVEMASFFAIVYNKS